MSKKVENPSQYKQGEIEVIEFTSAKPTFEQICNEIIESRANAREFYIEKKLKAGINRALEPDNVEGFHKNNYFHVIEISAANHSAQIAKAALEMKKALERINVLLEIWDGPRVKRGPIPSDYRKLAEDILEKLDSIMRGDG